MLWMLKGAGSNLAIVLSLTLRAYPVSSVSISQVYFPRLFFLSA